MKKKRKKNTLAYHPLTFQSFPFPIASVPWERKSGSAPDDPNKSNDESEVHSCYEFACKLFGKEELKWQADVHFSNICLRTFSKQLTEKTHVKWDTVQVDDYVFIYVPYGLSRDSFIALLDYAEEELGVSKAFVCLDRGSQNFGELVKAFRFMGFEHVTPDQQFEILNVPSSPRGFHFLGYEFD